MLAVELLAALNRNTKRLNGFSIQRDPPVFKLNYLKNQ